MKTDKANNIGLSESDQLALIEGARDRRPVSGLTHDFYKYPARFSPAFVRSTINIFTRPGDLVLDPHMGGATTLVEALALGRDAIGVDISTLSEFVAKAKTTVFSEAELDRLAEWTKRLPRAVDMRKASCRLSDYDARGYYRHLDHPDRWRLRKAIEQSLAAATRLQTPRLETFGRCVVLRVAQWALDGRGKQTTVDDFRTKLGETALAMFEGARQFRAAVIANQAGRRPTTKMLRRSAAGLEDDARVEWTRAPRLVVTSPPYPGVHVLYHRWQVDGRKEAPLPFMIANKLDGAGGSHYTMGDRHETELRTYFEGVRATMSSVAALADEQTIIVQMLAFAQPSWQLDRYLQTMEDSGLQELFLPALSNESDGRLWRTVPGRRWYSELRGETPGSQEVVLIHRKADRTSKPPLAAFWAASSTAAR